MVGGISRHVAKFGEFQAMTFVASTIYISIDILYPFVSMPVQNSSMLSAYRICS